MIVHVPQSQGVDGAVGQPGEGTAQIVQLIVGVDGGDEGQTGAALEQPAHEVAPGAVAVDDLIALGAHLVLQLGQHPGEIAAGQHGGVDAQLAGLMDEGTVGEADHGHLNAGGKSLKQGMDVSLGAAGIAAADESDDFHKIQSLRKNKRQKGLVLN